MNVFTATRRLAFVEKLFAQAGLDLEAFVTAGDESALQAHLAAQQSAVETRAAQAVPAAELATARTELAAARTDLAAAQARVGALVATLASAGVDVAADTAPEQIAARLADRISLKAAELTAAVGTRPLEVVPPAGPASTAQAPAAPAVSGFARAQAAFATQNAARA